MLIILLGQGLKFLFLCAYNNSGLEKFYFAWFRFSPPWETAE